MTAPVPRLLVSATVSFVGGILLAPRLAVPIPAVLAAAVLALAAALIIRQRALRLSYGLVLLAFLLAGTGAALQARSEVQGPLRAYAGHFVMVEGVVAEEPECREDKTFFILQVNSLVSGAGGRSSCGRVLAVLPGKSFRYGYGDLLRVRGLLLLPRDTGNPGAFSYRSYLERKGVGMLLLVRGDGSVTRLGSGDGSVRGCALSIKKRLLTGLGSSLTPEQSAVVAGIVFGERASIPDSLNAVFAETGVVHVLSVSGLHVGFLLGVVLFVARVCRLGPAAVLILAATVLYAYVLLVGFKPPVLRASVMWLMLLGAQQLGRSRDWPTAMAAAALLILTLQPLAVYDVGFQLSFAATWGILFIGPELVKGAATLAGRLGWAWRASWGWFLAVPAAAQLATWPIVAYYYNLFSTYSLLANWVAVPLVGLIFVLGLLASVLGAAVPALSWVVGPFTGALVDLFTWIVREVALLPGAAPVVPSPAPWLIGVWFVLLYSGVRIFAEKEWRERLGMFFEGRRRVTAVLLVLAVTVWLIPAGPRQLEVHFIDVGQGDSILLQTPGGKHVLVDTGGWRGELETASGAGDGVVVPYLKRLGIDRIDILVLTHLHEDHAGGTRAVVDALNVAAAALPPAGADEDRRGSELRLFLEGRGITLSEVKAGDRIAIDPAVDIAVLAPLVPLLKGTGADANNNSVVMRVTYGGVAFLLAGDVGLEGQERLVKSGLSLKADVLKVPHHGSVLDEGFLNRVQPKTAVIPVGEGNRFGLPRQETVDLLRRRGIKVLRTDRDGAVIIKSDGRQVRVETGRPASREMLRFPNAGRSFSPSPLFPAPEGQPGILVHTAFKGHG
ncbi:MAG: DNA internalization-related competence protein ComEC/Rec2 [Bacillota bacterium]